MKQITAIGFDLFNTLIIVNPDSLPEATSRLVRHLESNGFSIEEEPFIAAYRAAAFRFLEESKQNGIETHNSIWISAALESQGQTAPPDDPRRWEAVDINNGTWRRITSSDARDLQHKSIGVRYSF